jgi:cyclomaltodextrinase
MNTPPDWVRDAVFYQIFPDRFARSRDVRAVAQATPYGPPGELEPWDAPPTPHGFKGGDLFGVAERLDEIVDLGVNALYLNPIFSSASNHRYHAYDYLAVDPLLGGDAALRRLVDEAHARGIRVMLDGVFNHSGRGFWPFHHILEAGGQSPYRDWFVLDPDVLAGKRQLNAYPRSASASEPPLGYQAWWNLPALPKLNVAHGPAAEYLWAVGQHWLRFGVDAWRLDVPDEIRVPGFWETFRERCLEVDPECYFVGEIWEHAPDWLNGRFDGLMNYPLGAAIMSFAGGDHLHRDTITAHHTYNLTIKRLDPAGFAAALATNMSVYPQPTIEAQLNLVGSHDTPRVLNVMGGDRNAVRLAMLLLLTLPGAPNIYYGDEIGMEGGDDPDCRRSFPADPHAGDRDMRALVRALIAARHENEALRRGTAEVVATGATSVAILRTSGSHRALVVLNPADAPDHLVVSRGAMSQAIKLLSLPAWSAVPDPRVTSGEDGSLSIELPAQAGGVLLGDA